MVLAQKQVHGSVEQHSPEITPCTYGQLIYNKGGNSIQWRKTVSPISGAWKTTCKRMKLEHFLTLYTKINSKWIKDLNEKTIKLLEENTSSTLSDTGLSNSF